MSELDGKLYRPGLLGPLAPDVRGALKQRFLFPPFSVWNTRDGEWQRRKRAWVRLGIKSELGRDAVTYQIGNKAEWDEQQKRKANKKIEPGGGGGPNSRYIRAGQNEDGGATGTSIFDPVVCELAYTWWAPAGGVVLDPFAGGSVRGVVASVLGLRYWGCDLRKAQITANRDQINDRTMGKYKPRWVCGDSRDAIDAAPPADFIFTCPPYGDLEVYSDDPRDISTMEYRDFLESFGVIVAKACGKLKKNRFAAVVVGNFRDRSNGVMRDFVGDTIRAFELCGARFYNDIILVNAVGSAPVRTNNTFIAGSRKVVKMHQNVLVFAKGDPKAAAQRLRDCRY